MKRRRLSRVATAIVLVITLPGWASFDCRCAHEEAQADRHTHDHDGADHHGAGSEPADGPSQCDCGCDCTVAALVPMKSMKRNISAPCVRTGMVANFRELERLASLPSIQYGIGPPGCSGVPTYLAVLHLLC